MGKIQTRDGIVIAGIPESAMEDTTMLRQFTNMVRNTTGSGEYNYADLAKGYSQMRGASSMSGDPETRAAERENVQPSDKVALGETATPTRTPPPPTGFSPARAVGGVVRETAPYAAGTLGGAALGAATGVDPRLAAGAGFAASGLTSQSSEMLAPLLDQAIQQGNFAYAQQLYEQMNFPEGAQKAINIARAASDSALSPAGPIGGAVLEATGVNKAIADKINPVIIGLLEKGDYQTVRELTDALMDKAGVPEPQTPGEQVVADIARGGMEAASGAQLGKALQAAGGALRAPTTTSRVGQVLAEKPIQQITGGMGAEAAASGAEALGAGPGVQLAAGIGGDLLGSGAGVGVEQLGRMASAASGGVPESVRRVLPGLTAPEIPEATRRQIAMGEAQDIPVLSSDVLRSRSDAPGRRELDLRVTQERAREAAVNDLLVDYGIDPQKIDASISPLIDDFEAKHAEDLAMWTGEKKDVMQRIAEMSEDTVDTAEAVKFLDDEIARVSGLGTREFDPLVNKLVDWREAVQNKDIEQLEVLRKQFGRSFSDPNLANVKNEGEKIFNQFYGLLNEDMGRHIQNVGSEADYNQWKVANTQLSEMMNNFDNQALRTLIENSANRAEGLPTSGSSYEAIQTLLFRQDPERAQWLYDRLTPAGRQRMQTVLMGVAAEEASDLGRLSTNQFARNLKKYEDTFGVAFDEDAMERMEGLRRALELTSAAEPMSGAIPTAGRLPGEELPGGRTLAAKAIRMNPLIGLATATGANYVSDQVAAQFESPQMRDYLIRLANVPRTELYSDKGVDLAKRIMEISRSQASTGNVPGLAEREQVKEEQLAQQQAEIDAMLSQGRVR